LRALQKLIRGDARAGLPIGISSDSSPETAISKLKGVVRLSSCYHISIPCSGPSRRRHALCARHGTARQSVLYEEDRIENA